MSKLFPTVFDKEYRDQFNTGTSGYGAASVNGQLPTLGDIFKGPPGDNPEEAKILYIESHNPDRANKEWEPFMNLCSRIHRSYLRLWGL